MKFKAALAAMALIAVAAVSVAAQPVFAADMSSPGHHGSGKKTQVESRSAGVVHPMYDSNDPIDSGCASSATTAATSGTYWDNNGHSFVVQIRVSSGCNKAWVRFWQTNGNGACVYGNPPPDWIVIYGPNGEQQSEAGTYVCDDAWSDMVDYRSGSMTAYFNDGSVDQIVAYA